MQLATPKEKQGIQNLRQPTQNYRVQLTLPSSVNLDLLGMWFKEAFEIEDTHVAKSDIEHITFKALLLIKTLLQNSQIPVFYDGAIKQIAQGEREANSFTIDLSVGYIGFIPNQHYTTVVNFSFKYIFWMMQNSLTPHNKQILYKACLDEIINPITATMPIGKSTKHMLKVAYGKNIPFMHLGAGVYQLGWGAKMRKIDRSTIDRDSAMGSKLSQNKIVTANLLRVAGLPFAVHGVVNTKEAALKVANQLKYPLVVKPSDLDRGEGVSVNIANDTQLIKAYEEAFSLSRSKQILVEKQVEGICYRLFMAHGKLIYAVRRDPISVQGDGVHTVSELIAEANQKEDAKAPWLKIKPFPNDALALESIAKCGYTLDSIPPKEIWVPLRDIESSKWGGGSVDFTHTLHPENLDIALRAAKLFELSVVGVDIITTDISKPWHETGAIINEVNFAPLFGESEVSQSYMPNFFDDFIDKDGRIPIEIFIGEDEQSMIQAKERQKKLTKDGLKCFLTTHQTTENELNEEIPLSTVGVANRAQALLLNPEVEALILVLQNDELLHGYTPFDKVSKVTLLSKPSEEDFKSKLLHEFTKIGVAQTR